MPRGTRRGPRWRGARRAAPRPARWRRRAVELLAGAQPAVRSRSGPWSWRRRRRGRRRAAPAPGRRRGRRRAGPASPPRDGGRSRCARGPGWPRRRRSAAGVSVGRLVRVAGLGAVGEGARAVAVDQGLHGVGQGGVDQPGDRPVAGGRAEVDQLAQGRRRRGRRPRPPLPSAGRPGVLDRAAQRDHQRGSTLARVSVGRGAGRCGPARRRRRRAPRWCCRGRGRRTSRRRAPRPGSGCA